MSRKLILDRIFVRNRQKLKFWSKIEILANIEILVKNRNFGQKFCWKKMKFCWKKKWNFVEKKMKFCWKKNEIFVKNWNVGQKLKCWSKIEIFIKYWNLDQKSNFLMKKWNFVEKLIFWSYMNPKNPKTHIWLRVTSVAYFESILNSVKNNNLTNNPISNKFKLDIVI